MLAEEVDQSLVVLPGDHGKGIAFGGALLVVDDPHRAFPPDAPTGATRPQAEVDVFRAIEDLLVERIDPSEDFPADDLAGADQVVDFAAVGSVPVVHLVVGEGSFATEDPEERQSPGEQCQRGGKTLGVHLGGAVGKCQSAAGDPQSGIGVQARDKRAQRVLDEFQIGVEDGHVATFGQGDPLVPGRGDATIFPIFHQLDGGEPRFHHFGGPVVRSVVDADDFQRQPSGKSEQGVQHPFQEVSHLPGNDDDGDVWGLAYSALML